MKAGETVRFDCDDCSAEIEVCLEPKAKGMKNPPKAEETVKHCPFCGGPVQTDEDD
jgi:hypothetical protein